MPYTVNICALTGKKPCINKGFLVVLMHRKLTFNMIVPSPLKLFRHTLFNWHNTINWWCNRPIKIVSLRTWKTLMYGKTCLIPILLHKKAVSKTFNSRALTSEKPCINKEFHVPLMHRYFSYARFRAILHQYRRSITFAVEAINKTVYVRVMQILIL